MIKDIILFVILLLLITICNFLLADAIVKTETSVRQEAYEQYDFPSGDKCIINDGEYKTVELSD